jgi:hypothetical protein
MRSVTTLLTLLVILGPLPAAAQGPPAYPRDEEVKNYRLSMPKLHRLVEVQRQLNAVHASNPAPFDKMDGEMAAEAKKKGAPLTSAQRAAVIDRYPEVRRVLTGAGTTTRDWVLTSEAMGDAHVALEVKKGTLPPEAAGSPPTTTAQKANVALLEKNQAEWQKILQELERLGDELLQ